MCVHEVLSFAIQQSDLPIIVEMDSLILVSMLQDFELDRSIYSSLVMEIRYLRGLRETCITHVNRTQNKVSYCLASLCKSRGEDDDLGRVGSYKNVRVRSCRLYEHYH